MSLKDKFKRAEEIVNELPPHDLESLQGICEEICSAQIWLQKESASAIQYCFSTCKGICCRNFYINSIITLQDFVMILTVRPPNLHEIRSCLARENTLYSADCIFLKNSIGPCLFPQNAKPQFCTVSFCSSDKKMKAGLNGVKNGFSKLFWFVFFRKAEFFKGLFFNLSLWAFTCAVAGSDQAGQL